jgi:hypothetical protein
MYVCRRSYQRLRDAAVAAATALQRTARGRQGRWCGMPGMTWHVFWRVGLRAYFRYELSVSSMQRIFTETHGVTN